MIKAITFDFWSTLYKSQTVKREERLLFLKRGIEQGQEMAVEMNALVQAVEAARSAWAIAWVEEQRTMGAGEWLSIVLQDLGLALESKALAAIEQNIENTILDNLPALVAEAKTVLPFLAAHYRLAIISDTGLTPGRVLRQILARDSLTAYFDHYTFSDEIGYSKPHPQAFLSTLRALDAQPHEAVHVGDLLRTDIAGARRVGMRAVQYVGLNFDNTEADVAPDAVIRNHQELRQVLRRWGDLL